MPGALEGLRILDLTRLLPGAVATQWLAEFGAEVIKIEQPSIGDYARQSYAALFEQTNRGKKSVEIDLKSGQESFLTLVRSADVLIEGFRPGVMDRLGTGYDVLRVVNPRLIYVALTGYGSDGPHAQLAGHDVNYLAMSGVLDLIRAGDGTPVIPGVQIADLAGGSMQAIIRILLAIEARHRSGRGQRVDVSMTDGLTALLPVVRAEQGSTEGAKRGLLSGKYACYHVYPAAESSYVAVGALESKFWANLCRELGCEELIELQFIADQSSVIASLEERFKAATAEEWFERIGAKDCCVTPVLRAHGASPLSSLGRAPRLGEHNGELLGGSRKAEDAGST
jgi:crotonobetainyl-CoA:carnitine CoA-transferase CaiB-like acyl-CoA transferase